MKREILFKGKRVDNGQWVEGKSLIQGVIEGCEFVQIEHSDFDNYRQYEVDPETVCQFTGLIDKNGNKIFCGDYCNDTMEKGLIMVVVWDKYLCHFRMDVRFLGEPKKPIKLDGYVNVCDVYDIITEEIIGNIHD